MEVDNGSELALQETTSMSSVEESLNISFEDISYSVRRHLFTRERKVILDNLSGAFNAGELTVILGQSGAGKSILLDILAGYTKPSSGGLLVNGSPRNQRLFRRRSCYILQDDKVQDMLTIQESLCLAAEFKLGDHVSKDLKKRRVNEIITSLGLSSARDTRAANLSGGERKRLAIGLELVSDPAVMFLDEPTSGLDSSISRQVVYLLHLLARQGRTVVVTMHQPSAALLQMVDRLYAVSEGKCAYMGSVLKLLPYLAEMDFNCPPYHNPVDFLIEVCSENASNLVEKSENGRSMQWVHNISQKTDSKLIGDHSRNISEEVYLTTLPSPRENPTNRIMSKLKSTYSTSAWKQFTTLTRRALLINWRNPSFTVMITGIHCGIALFVGFLFYNIGGEAFYTRTNYNFMYFSLMFLMYTSFSAVTVNFPSQIPIVRREHFNRWYSTGTFYASSLVGALPTQTVCTLSFTIIVYWLTGQPAEVMRFFGFCWILLMVSYVSLCVGLLNGSTFNVKNGVVFGPFLIMPFTIFSGFFLLYEDAPFIFRWIFHTSFLKHGLVGVVLSILGFDRAKLPCTHLYCHDAYPVHFLKTVGIYGEKYSIAVAALFTTAFVVIVLGYLILKIRLKRKCAMLSTMSSRETRRSRPPPRSAGGARAFEYT